jgi:hypothetical protein
MSEVDSRADADPDDPQPVDATDEPPAKKVKQSVRYPLFFCYRIIRDRWTWATGTTLRYWTFLICFFIVLEKAPGSFFPLLNKIFENVSSQNYSMLLTVF